MPKEITAEERAARIERQRESAKRNREARAEMERQRKAEKENTIRILREIRDSDEATPADRLKAIEMLSELLPKY